MIHLRSYGMRPSRVATLIFILVFGSFLSFAQNPAPPAQAPEAPPYQWPRSHNYDVQHYRIELSFDWTKRSVTGETTIKFQPLGGDLKEVEIDAGDMTIKAVKLAGGAALKYRYVTNEKLYVTLDRAYPPGRMYPLQSAMLRRQSKD